MNSASPIHGQHAIGIDVGGTKIAGGIVDLATGRLTGRQQSPTEYQRGGEAVLADVATMARGPSAQVPRPATLGVAVAELVDPTGQVCSDHLIAWKGKDLAARLSPISHTVISSDVRAAALAEARFGTERGLRDFYFVTIGTRISGVLVHNGTPYAGSRGAALVIANGVTRHHCSACGHITAQVVGHIANGPGLAAAYGQSAEILLADANAGNPRAIHLIDHATQGPGRVLAGSWLADRPSGPWPGRRDYRRGIGHPNDITDITGRDHMTHQTFATPLNRRTFLRGSATAGAILALRRGAFAQAEGALLLWLPGGSELFCKIHTGLLDGFSASAGLGAATTVCGLGQDTEFTQALIGSITSGNPPDISMLWDSPVALGA